LTSLGDATKNSAKSVTCGEAAQASRQIPKRSQKGRSDLTPVASPRVRAPSSPVYTPDELEARIEQIGADVGGRAFVIERDHKRHREMWCAARFGKGFAKRFGPCGIEIDDADEQLQHDFRLHARGEVLPFQIAEVMPENFPRAAVYRNLTESEIRAYHSREAYIGREAAAARVADVLRSKVDRYGVSRDLRVLLYLNLNAAAAPWPLLSATTESEALSFASIWVITGDMFCCLHGGRRWAGNVRWFAMSSTHSHGRAG
jgi:hypothetical protein